MAANIIFRRVCWGIVFLFVLLWFGYMFAADYGYSAVSGTYEFHDGGEESTLILKADGSFQQELKKKGKVHRVRGNWARFGEGGIVFSKEFVRLAGQETHADGQAFGAVTKSFLFFPSIELDPRPGGPVFHKRWHGKPIDH